MCFIDLLCLTSIFISASIKSFVRTRGFEAERQTCTSALYMVCKFLQNLASVAWLQTHNQVQRINQLLFFIYRTFLNVSCSNFYNLTKMIKCLKVEIFSAALVVFFNCTMPIAMSVKKQVFRVLNFIFLIVNISSIYFNSCWPWIHFI